MKKVSEKVEISWTPDSSMWIKLYRFYNFDNPYDMIFYFYERNKEDEILKAISFGFSDMGVRRQSEAYVIEDVTFDYGYPGDAIHMRDDLGDDSFEIHEGDLELSDTDSIGDILVNIFELPLNDKNNGLQKFEKIYKKLKV